VNAILLQFAREARPYDLDLIIHVQGLEGFSSASSLTIMHVHLNDVRIDVATPSRGYSVALGDGIIDRLGALLDEYRLPARRFVVSNSLIWKLHGERLSTSTAVNEPILIPDGERFKQLQTVGRVYDALVRASADRASTLVTFGGGVIGDLAGFAASTYLRGIPLVHVPTTLLAQVDSAIGGKVGVNHPQGKNLIGSFYQPHAVVIDPSVLVTLPRREFRAGLYEVVKYGMTSSAPLFDRIRQDRDAIFGKDVSVLTAIISESCRIKAAVVSADEHESGLRRILNFGHTAGHALEAVTRYRRFLHGEAVAYGMLVAAELAAARGALARPSQAALADLIAGLGPLPPIADVPVNDMQDSMKHDKKVVAGRLHFVLATAIGSTTIVDDVTESELTAALVAVGFRR
jgi:3-dehydroquinate synthase